MTRFTVPFNRWMLIIIAIMLMAFTTGSFSLAAQSQSKNSDVKYVDGFNDLGMNPLIKLTLSEATDRGGTIYLSTVYFEQNLDTAGSRANLQALVQMYDLDFSALILAHGANGATWQEIINWRKNGAQFVDTYSLISAILRSDETTNFRKKEMVENQSFTGILPENLIDTGAMAVRLKSPTFSDSLAAVHVPLINMEDVHYVAEVATGCMNCHNAMEMPALTAAGFQKIYFLNGNGLVDNHGTIQFQDMIGLGLRGVPLKMPTHSLGGTEICLISGMQIDDSLKNADDNRILIGLIIV